MIDITNEEFLKVLFGEEYEDVYVTSFLDDPSDISSDRRAICWGGGSFGGTYMNEEDNQYFCISLFNPDDKGKPRRRKVLFKACHVIVADDVCEKLPIDRVEKLPAPSWKLKSSNYSEQWGWILDKGCEDRGRVENLLDGLVTRGLAPEGVDPGMRGCTRLIRTPNGVNTKAKRVVENFGVAPRVKLIEWNPEVRVTMEELAEPFGIDLDGERRDEVIDGAVLVADHPLLTCGLIKVKSVLSPGRYDLICPWVDEHGGAVDDGAAMFTNEDGTFGFCCHHGSCCERTGRDLVEWIEAQQPGFEQLLKSWIVRRSFDKIIGGSGDEGVGNGDNGGVAVSPDNNDNNGNAVDTFLARLPECKDSKMIEALCRVAVIGVDDVWRVEKVVQKLLKEVGGSSPGVGVVRSWFKPEIVGIESLPEWATGWCYLTHSKDLFLRGNGVKISREAFNVSHRQHSNDDLPVDLLSKNGVLPVFWNVMYLPGAGSEFSFDGKECINSFKGWAKFEGVLNGVSESEQVRIWELVVSHAKSRFPIKWYILLDYFAYCYQHRGSRVLWMPIIQGVPGDGKSYWGRLMSAVLGVSNVGSVGIGEITSPHTDWAEGHCLKILEEIKISGANRFEVLDKLKPYLTNNIIRVHPKGLKGYDVPNTANYIGFTNHQDAIPVDDNDRRIVPFFSTKQMKGQLEGKEYFDRLYDDTVNSITGVAVVAKELMRWKISKDFSASVPPVIEGDTDKEAMIEATKSELRMMVEDYIESLPDKKLIKFNDIKRAFSNPMSEFYCDWYTQGIAKELRSMGYINKKRRILGVQCRVWVLPQM